MRRGIARRSPAASELPPPKPASDGILLVRWISIGGTGAISETSWRAFWIVLSAGSRSQSEVTRELEGDWVISNSSKRPTAWKMVRRGWYPRASLGPTARKRLTLAGQKTRRRTGRSYPLILGCASVPVVHLRPRWDLISRQYRSASRGRYGGGAPQTGQPYPISYEQLEPDA